MLFVKPYFGTLLSILLLHCTFVPLKSSGCGRGKFADKKEPLNEKKVELILDIIYAPAGLSDLFENDNTATWLTGVFTAEVTTVTK